MSNGRGIQRQFLARSPRDSCQESLSDSFLSLIGNGYYIATVEPAQMRIAATREHRTAIIAYSRI
jgi:hypothetical protein